MSGLGAKPTLACIASERDKGRLTAIAALVVAVPARPAAALARGRRVAIVVLGSCVLFA